MQAYRWRIELDGCRHLVQVEFATGRGAVGLWVNGREIDAGALRRGQKRHAFMLGRHACVLDASISSGLNGGPLNPLLMVDGRFIPPSPETEEDRLLRPASEGNAGAARLLRPAGSSDETNTQNLVRPAYPAGAGNQITSDTERTSE